MSALLPSLPLTPSLAPSSAFGNADHSPRGTGTTFVAPKKSKKRRASNDTHDCAVNNEAEKEDETMQSDVEDPQVRQDAQATGSKKTSKRAVKKQKVSAIRLSNMHASKH